MRMFVAAVPPQDIIDELASFLEPRHEADRALRWTEPFQWHVTLAFLPEVPSRCEAELVERLDRAARRRQPFDVRLGGSGAFPSAARARVLWLGAVSEPAGSLPHVATAARAAAGKAGARVQGGRFRPHVTLARLRTPQDGTRWLRVLDSFPATSWQVDSIQLIASHLGQGPGGHPRYDEVATLMLGHSG